MEFTLNSCSSQCPGASIYRLGAQMSVRQNIPWHRPDGGHGPSGMDQRIDGRLDGMARSSRRLTRNLNSSDLQTLNSGIPVYSIFTLK
jgi:hypothetical protein